MGDKGSAVRIRHNSHCRISVIYRQVGMLIVSCIVNHSRVIGDVRFYRVIPDLISLLSSRGLWGVFYFLSERSK
ncbi:MAG: hypothetical protein UHH95_01280 [Oscillospiraceae bacterium]|nr:hypothetical protein [Oscillospiraceae bacterium]